MTAIQKDSWFSPPNWIQGTWGNTMANISFQFTKENVLEFIDKDTVNYNVAMNSASLNGAVLNESISETYYMVRISTSGSVTAHIFQRASDTTVAYTQTWTYNNLILSKK